RLAIAKLPKKVRGEGGVVIRFRLKGHKLIFMHGAENEKHEKAASRVVTAIMAHGLVAQRHESKYPLAERLPSVDFIGVHNRNLKLHIR
ncbi:MAG: hypothetical protein V1644_01755, partial [Candidatus Micrarchaeota archaeon]